MKKNKTTIGIDIDGVLGYFTEDLSDYVKKKFNFDVVNPHVYPLAERFGLKGGRDTSVKLLLNYIKDNQYIKMRPNKKAIKFFNSLKCNKVIITSRYPIGSDQDEEVKNIIVDETKKWLDKHGMKRDKLIFTRDKVKHVKENKVDFFFEDYFVNAEKIGKIAKSFLVTCDWNVKETLVNSIRINKVEDAADFINAAEEELTE